MNYAAPGTVDRNMSYIIAGNLLVSLPGCRCWRRYLNYCSFIVWEVTVDTGLQVARGPSIMRENVTLNLLYP